VRVPPGLQAFVVKLLARDERFNELHQFIAGKLVEPSRAVALQLVEVGTHHTPTRKLGMEMLRLLHAHSDYVKLLLQDGRMLEGLRYIRRNKVVLSVSSSLVLLVTGLANSNIISVRSHGVIPSWLVWTPFCCHPYPSSNFLEFFLLFILSCVCDHDYSFPNAEGCK
jgi:hypothetical protein